MTSSIVGSPPYMGLYTKRSGGNDRNRTDVVQIKNLLHSHFATFPYTPAHIPQKNQKQGVCAGLHLSGMVAGLVGIEPTHPGVKAPCLTTWLQPYTEGWRGEDLHPYHGLVAATPSPFFGSPLIPTTIIKNSLYFTEPYEIGFPQETGQILSAHKVRLPPTLAPTQSFGCAASLVPSCHNAIGLNPSGSHGRGRP